MIVTSWLNGTCKFAKRDTARRSSIAIFRDLDETPQVLVGKQRKYPDDGWLLPGGRVDPEEIPFETALRELKEETGLSASLILAGVLRYHRVDTIFTGEMPKEGQVESESDLMSPTWFPVSALPPLLFGHEEAVKLALDALQKSRQQKRSGMLIVFEGIDGSGKTSQIKLLTEALSKGGYPVTVTKWNSSQLVSEVIRKAKQKKLLTPMTFSLLHATDMLYRHDTIIKPALGRNEAVLCDRYCYTSVVRDTIRGVDRGLIEKAYEGMRDPDILFHCVVPVPVAVSRVISGKGLSHYGSGMDMNLSHTKEQSCLKYEQMMHDKYMEILPGQPNYISLDMSRKIEEIFLDIKATIEKRLRVKL